MYALSIEIISRIDFPWLLSVRYKILENCWVNSDNQWCLIRCSTWNWQRKKCISFSHDLNCVFCLSHIDLKILYQQPAILSAILIFSLSIGFIIKHCKLIVQIKTSRMALIKKKCFVKLLCSKDLLGLTANDDFAGRMFVIL